MRIDIDYDTGLYKIVDLTPEQLSTILDCILFAKDHGMEWPDGKNAKQRGIGYDIGAMQQG